MRSELEVRLQRSPGGVVHASGTLAVPPFWCRWDGRTLWFVGSAASPVADDDITLRVAVDRGVTAEVRNVAATVVYAGRGDGTRLRTDVSVADDATLIWQPEPLIVTERARHRSTTLINVADGGTVLADEMIVFGRVGETAGSLCSTIDLRLGDDRTALTSFDSSLPAWDGTGGTGGAKVLATRVVVDPLAGGSGRIGSPSSADEPDHVGDVDERSVVLRPERGGAIATVLGATPADARAALHRRLTLSSLVG